MSQELRHRAVTAASPNTSTMKQSTGLTVHSMQAASPQQTGKVMKLHVSPFYTILPRFLQKWILKIWFLSFLRPSWKARYLILLGSYLYKFQDEQNPNQQPKGAPIPVDGVDVHLAGSNEDAVVALSQQLLVGYTTVICVSTLRKKYYFACASREEALTWVNSLRDGRQEAVTRAMGHAVRDSYPQSWTYFDSLGNSLVKSKDRIRTRMEQSNLRELEMSNLTEGGPAPKGYYG
jgi:PH domain